MTDDAIGRLNSDNSNGCKLEKSFKFTIIDDIFIKYVYDAYKYLIKYVPEHISNLENSAFYDFISTKQNEKIWKGRENLERLLLYSNKPYIYGQFKFNYDSEKNCYLG